MKPPLPPAWQALADRPAPAQDANRYGPTVPPVTDEPHERDGLLLYVNEGGGWSVTCRCGWLRWSTDKTQTKTWGKAHAAPTKKGDGVTYACPTLRKDTRP